MKPKTFRYEVRDRIGRITLNRPKTLNSLTFQTYAELRDFFAALDSDAESRVIIFGGEGRAFCSGGDVQEIIKPLLDMSPSGQLEFCRMTCDVVRNIRRVGKPVIAELKGPTVGAGAVLAAACDVRIAADDTRIAFLFPRVGLSGADMGAAYLLPRIVGLGVAGELLLTGRFVDADEAARIGLVNRVVPREALERETEAFARRLARGPREALAVTRRMIDRELFATLEEALELEAVAQSKLMQGRDFRRAYEAFVEKREPDFEG